MATKFGTEARLGLFVILGFLAFIWGTTQLTHLGEDGGYELTAVFKNASGLDVNAPVRMVGVTVGRVKSIGIMERRALVTLLIQDKYRIDKDATLSIRSQGILGDKVVEIIPGKAKEYLGAGEEVKNTKAAVDLDSLMESLQSAGDDLSVILSSFRKVVGTEEGEQNMKDILHNTKNLSANLNSLVAHNRERVDSILTNFDQLTAKLDGMAGENREDIRELIANIKDVSENLKKTIPDLTAKLQSAAEQITGVLAENRDDVRETVDQIKRDAELLEDTLQSLRTVTKRIEDGEGTIGKLINEDEPYNNLNETLAGVNKMIKRADRLRVNLDVHGNHLSAVEGTKGYITVDLQPTPEKFYRIELVDDPEGVREHETTTTVTTVGAGSPVTTTTDKVTITDADFKFSLQMGRRFHDTIFRIGYIESDFGFGIDHYSFDEDLRWTFDMYDLGREENPRLRFAISWKFLDFFHIDLGTEDFINSQRDPSLLVGMGLRFVDDDLKYLISKAPIP